MVFGMEQVSGIKDLSKVLKNMPIDWLNLTTHRLDIYNESLAKTQFLESLEKLIEKNSIQTSALNNLPTAFDYIRLGHPLSCILEWAIAKLNNLPAENVISFGSKTAPILAILRKKFI
jgi:cystathionine beta-lyase/cystathionine gamma-synthase